jgi:CAAX protease family protein
MFLENATRGDNQFWRYFISILIVILAYIIGQVPLGVVVFLMAPNPDVLMEFAKKIDFSLIGLNPNLGLLLLLFMFVLSFLALLFVVVKIHNKKFIDVVTARNKIDWGRIFWAFGLWMGLTILAETVFYFLSPENYITQFDLGLFIPLVLIALLIMPIQTSFEEIFVRGYLLQGIGLIGVYRMVPLIVTSLVFGTLHMMNPEIESFGLGIMMIFYIGSGIVMGLIALMDEGLELSLGLHAANNIYSTLFVTYAGGALQTSAIFKTEELDQQLMLMGWLAVSAVFIFLAAKKYNWKNWGKLLGKIDFSIGPKE